MHRDTEATNGGNSFQSLEYEMQSLSIQKSIVSLLVPCFALVFGSFASAESTNSSADVNSSVVSQSADFEMTAIPGKKFRKATVKKVKGSPNDEFAEVTITDKNGNDHDLHVPYDSSWRRELEELEASGDTATIKTTNGIVTGID